MIKISSNIGQVIKRLHSSVDRIATTHSVRLENELSVRLSRLRCPDHDQHPVIGSSKGQSPYSREISVRFCCPKFKQIIDQTFAKFKSEVKR